MADYVPAAPQQPKDMMSTVGVRSMAELFADIPEKVRLPRQLNLPAPLSEMELASELQQVAARNRNLSELVCFLGAGAYDHYVPAAVKNLTARQEFYTAYTPYQPEISQGTLQAIFEFQSMICQLTEMDVANASMYDGASALAEAALLAAQATHKKSLLVSAGLHPDSRAVLETYARFSDLRIEELAGCPASGETDPAIVQQLLHEDVAAVIVQNPNFYGVIEPLAQIGACLADSKAMFLVSCDPLSLGVLQSPGSAGADIVTGDGQSLGNGMPFGGPSLGFFAARRDLLRRMPGRIVGETTDARGRRSYVLTIQTREQHIRREKATSNICTNQALNALTATIYLALNGPQGLARVAELCVRRSHLLRNRLLELPAFQPLFDGPFFREFTVRFSGDLHDLNRYLLKEGFIGGLPLAEIVPAQTNTWLLAVTEKRTEAEIDRFVDAVRRYLEERGLKA